VDSASGAADHSGRRIGREENEGRMIIRKSTFFIAIIAALSFGGAVRGLVQGFGTVESRPPICIGSSDVSDLIERLRPLTDNPDKPWYSNGFTLTFSGNDVTMRLKMPNNNEYNARAKTLDEAVSRLTQPSSEIQSALVGWKGK